MNWKKWWPAVVGAIVGVSLALYLLLMPGFGSKSIFYLNLLDLIIILVIIVVPTGIGVIISLLLNWILNRLQ